MQSFLRAQWDKRGLWAWLWLPLSLFVCLIARLKRWAYQRGIYSSTRVSAPVIVVGNLSVGGTGKTPLVAHIALLLLSHGYRPGIVSRGYKGAASQWPQTVTPASDPSQVGDEPVLLTTLTRCVVVAGPTRAESAQQLIQQHDCNVILSDDGFQHLKLARDINILVFDTANGNGLGNGWCLPSGPLRESASARKAAHMQVFHGATNTPVTADVYSMALLPDKIYSLKDRTVTPAERLRQQPLHAIAGIGRPARFFDTLRLMGLTIIEHAFDDHHPFSAKDLEFGDEYDLITTEKDAIKLTGIPTTQIIWVLPVVAKPGEPFDTDILQNLRKLKTP